MENRLIELETRLAFQEELIEQLNDALSTQQKELLRQADLISMIQQRLKEQQEQMPSPEQQEPPPPHY